MYIGLHVKYRLFLSGLNETSIFLERFSKNSQISNFMKIRPVGGELFHADGRTDMTKLIVAFLNFANAHKNWCANKLRAMLWDLNTTAIKIFHLVTTVWSRFTTGLRSRIFGCKSNRRKTSTI